MSILKLVKIGGACVLSTMSSIYNMFFILKGKNSEKEGKNKKMNNLGP
jgi:hypothetical protein